MGWLARLFALPLAGASLLLVSTGSETAARTASKDRTCVAVASAVEGRLCIEPGSGRSTWFKDCATCPEMVVVPRSPSGRIPKPLAVGRFAVTFDEWDACLADGGCNGYRPVDEGWGRGKQPVIHVNWADANAYAAWLTRKTGKAYRLMREHEREHAARAGSTSAYWWGDTISLDQANYDVPIPSRLRQGESRAELDRVRHRAMPVDSFEPNPWGLYTVHGNVWEWTADCLPEDGPMLASTPRGAAASCGRRLSRGGSWNDFADEARSAARVGFSPGSRNSSQGFRIARALP